MPTSEELIELADLCAAKLELDGKLRHVPSFSDAEEQCEDEYEDLLQAIHVGSRLAPCLPIDCARKTGNRIIQRLSAGRVDRLRFTRVDHFRWRRRRLVGGRSVLFQRLCLLDRGCRAGV